MYDWLNAATEGSSLVVTANRRLARTLRDMHAEQQMAAGRAGWHSPAIHEWQDWARLAVALHSDLGEPRIVISPYQSKMLWERCLRREITDPLLNYAALARLARDTYQSLDQWCVPLSACQRSARSNDQRLFAKIAGDYESILEHESWVDAAGNVRLAIELVQGPGIPIPSTVTLAGFDRISPRLQTLLDAFAGRGSTITRAVQTKESPQIAQRSLYVAENSDAELRAAGAWARHRVADQPDARVGIVVSELERDAQRSLRLIEEGLLPGWQYSEDDRRAAINISYGRKLSGYPVIANALMALQWLYRELPTLDVCQLLRASVFDETRVNARTALDLKLRQLPEQTWSAVQVLQRLRSGHEDGDAELQILAAIATHRSELPRRQSPGAWVALFSSILEELGWPGVSSLDSEQFQTINRWRELLNEVARLELVTKSMTIAEVYAHLASMAAETIFQAEGLQAAVSVMGPLEAAGLEFDALWVTGLSSTKWPPQGHALSLLSRDLQRDFEMPDATPADTLAYAERIIARLASSAPLQAFSYPRSQGDAELFASGLLESLDLDATQPAQDPDWFAKSLQDSAKLKIVMSDAAPELRDSESIVGGASTIQQQFIEPFAAFVTGRLGVRRLFPIEPGLPANVRGSLIHGALQKVYQDCPAQADIQAWSNAEVNQRCSMAVAAAFANLERHADATLAAILQLEKQRTLELLEGVISLDRGREAFGINAVEHVLEGRIAGLPLRIRVDRIDSNDAGQLVIIDYKTGAPKRFLGADQRPRDMQLVVYAAIATQPVAGLGLLNIDARNISLDAAGDAFPSKLDWSEALPAWLAEVEVAAGEIAAGDVRINGLQSILQARPLALLSRFRELQIGH